MTDARYGGLTSWEALSDATRAPATNSHWSTPADIIESAAHSFALDKWDGQDNYVEVWIEKDALVGVIEAACRKLDITHLSCRGYTSATEMWASAMRMRQQYSSYGRSPVVLHFGDHDPSGIDMSRDIEDRLTEFMAGTAPVNFQRLALNMDQVRKYNPPPNPAKLTDCRARGYIEVHGNESWELDALEPRVMLALVEKNVKRFRDDKLWTARVAEEALMRKQLTALSDNWTEAVEVLTDNGIFEE